MIPLLAILTLLGADFVAIDARTKAVIQQDWPDADRPIPMGSLVKPFTALAYRGDFPEFTCTGARCWLARGHGRINFREALANSCNEYFLNLASGVDPQTLSVVAAKFGIAAPVEDSAEARIGLGSSWRITPVALARAYAELAARSGEPRVAEILAGLRMSAEAGTAKALGKGVLAKTGTAPCVSEPKDAGDGFVLIMEPAEAPRRVVLVRVHAVPGAEAAKIARDILRKWK
jgi:cell division protein FtsI/penicillin-binding protein 2